MDTTRPEDMPEHEGPEQSEMAVGSTASAAQPKPAPSRALTVAAGLVGNVLEWYDFAVFGTFAADLGQLFFPSDDPAASLMETFAVFGGAFLMRPLGGVIFGYIGDRVGRRRALMVSVIMMAVSSFLIGCLPTYQMVLPEIGVWATVLLTLIRLVQGISVGGELVGSILFLVESSPRRHRGMYGALCLCSAVGGTTLGNVVGVILRSSLSEEDFLAWGWRIPFLLGIAVGGFGLLLRSHIPEPAAFELARQRQRHLMKTNPVKKAFRDHWREMGLVTGSSLFWIAGVWVFTTWLPQYLTHLTAHPTPGAFIISTVACLVFVLIFPAFGLLSDRFGRRPIMLIGTVGMALLSPLMFWLYNFGLVGTTIVGVSLQALLMAFVGSPLPTWMVEGFPAHVRYSAVAIGYNIVTAVFGGTAPLIATAIVAANPTFIYGPALYLSGLAAAASVVIFITPRVLGSRNHLDEDLAGADDLELLTPAGLARAALRPADAGGDAADHGPPSPGGGPDARPDGSDDDDGDGGARDGRDDKAGLLMLSAPI